MNKKKIILLIYISVSILIIWGLMSIPELCRKINYGKFQTVGNLILPRANHKSILIDNKILSYGGLDFDTQLNSRFDSVEIYNIDTQESNERKDIAKILQLTNLDIVKTWNEYLIVQRKGWHDDKIKDTIGYYNFKTEKFDRIIKSADEANILVLNNGDLFLYTALGAKKYIFDKNMFVNGKCQIKHYPSNVSTTAIPLKNNSILVISTENAYIYQNNECIPIEKISFNVNEFTNLNSNRQDAPQFISIGNNQFIVLTFNPYEHINKISLYKVENSKIQLIQEYKTKKIPYALVSGRIRLLDNDKIIIIGGIWRIMPPMFTLKSSRIYVFDMRKNNLYRVTSLNQSPFKYTSSVEFSDVVTNDQKIFIIGGYDGDYLNKIKVLDLKGKE